MRSAVMALFFVSMTVLSAAPAPADPTSDMAAMGQAFAAVKSFHADITAQGRTMSMDVIQPDKMHMTMNGKMQMIKIGGDMWMNMGGQWQHMPIAAGSMMQRPFDMARNAGMQEKGANNYTITDQGPALLDGTPTRKYHIVNKTDGSVVDMWLSKNLPVQIQVPDKSGTSTIKYSEYNSVPDITPPA
jgi:hypothetical protein